MNISRLLTASLTILVIASCNEMMVTENLGGAGYITVTSQVGPNVKAGYEISTYPNEFIMDVNQGSAEFNYSLLKMKRVENTLNVYGADNIEPIWASANHSNAIVKAMTMPSDVAQLNLDNTVDITISSDQTTDENFNKNDILGAKTGKNITISGDVVNIGFDHLMSKLHVVYETDNVTVESIKLKNVSMGGIYSYAEMNYISSNESLQSNEINMYLNAETSTAEAMFYPYTASSDPKIVVKLAGSEQELEYDIDITNGFVFEGGKLYVKNIAISSTDITANDEWIKNVPGGKILWVGTSIPAGNGSNNYPQMVANSTGLEIVNNSVGGSVVLPARPVWVTNFELGITEWNLLYAGGLSQTHLEAEERYKNCLAAGQITSAQLEEIKALSFESLIIPYIDGTIANCETIIIDHGFNDLVRIIDEANGFHGWDDPQYGGDSATQYADTYFEHYLNGTYLENAGIPDYNHYKAHLETLLWPNNFCVKEDSYLLAMEKIITACRKKNADINIIIGNYFTENNNWLHHHFNRTADAYKGHSYARTLCYYNKAVAKTFNCRGIVNVQDSFKDLTNDELWSNQYDPTNGAIFNEEKFCPDGIHPSSDHTGKSNRAIADVYLQELKRIFSPGSATRASSHSFDCGWEDVEIL